MELTSCRAWRSASNHFHPKVDLQLRVGNAVQSVAGLYSEVYGDPANQVVNNNLYYSAAGGQDSDLVSFDITINASANITRIIIWHGSD